MIIQSTETIAQFFSAKVALIQLFERESLLFWGSLHFVPDQKKKFRKFNTSPSSRSWALGVFHQDVRNF